MAKRNTAKRPRHPLKLLPRLLLATRHPRSPSLLLPSLSRSTRRWLSPDRGVWSQLTGPEIHNNDTRRSPCRFRRRCRRLGDSFFLIDRSVPCMFIRLLNSSIYPLIGLSRSPSFPPTTCPSFVSVVIAFLLNTSFDVSACTGWICT